jgi:hypothetical protein
VADSDPNRLVYFSQAGRLYRVAQPFLCTDARACAFRELDAAEVTELREVPQRLVIVPRASLPRAGRYV